MLSLTSTVKEFFTAIFCRYHRVRTALRTATLRMVSVIVILSLIIPNLTASAGATNATTLNQPQSLGATETAAPSTGENVRAARPVIGQQVEEYYLHQVFSGSDSCSAFNNVCYTLPEFTDVPADTVGWVASFSGSVTCNAKDINSYPCRSPGEYLEFALQADDGRFQRIRSSCCSSLASGGLTASYSDHRMCFSSAAVCAALGEADLGYPALGSDGTNDYHFAIWTFGSGLIDYAPLIIYRISTTPPPCSAAAQSLTDCLVAYWKLDEASGTRFSSVSNAVDLAPNGTITPIAGVVGNATRIDPASRLSTSDNAPNLNLNDTDFTLTAWVRVSNPSAFTTEILQHDGTSASRSYILHYQIGEIDWKNVNNNTSLILHTAALANQWQFVVITYNYTTGTALMSLDNGTPITLTLSPPAVSDVPFVIGDSAYMGRVTNTQPIDVDEVGIWKRVLTTEERSQLYNCGAGLTYPFAGASLSNCSVAAKLFVVSSQGEQSTNEVFRYRVEGPTDTPNLELTITDPSFDAPYGLTFSTSGEMFVVNRSSSHTTGSISRFLNPTGNPTSNGLITSNSFIGPVGAVFKNGELFIAQRHGNNVLRFIFDSAGNASSNGAITDGLCCSASRGVAVNPTTGELFVTECCSVDEINRYLFDANGNALPNGVITGGGLSNPHDMVFSPWGELFVANAGNNSVSRFTFDAAGNASVNGQLTGNGLNGAIGLAFSPWGELFVANHFVASVSRWIFDASFTASPNGSFATPNTLGDIEFSPTSSPSPLSIRITDAQGNPVNALSLNSDGWPVLNAADGTTIANPLTVTVSFSDASLAKIGRFFFEIDGARFFVVDSTVNICQPTITASNSYSFTSYRLPYCLLTPQPGQVFTWQVWIQPSAMATLQIKAQSLTENYTTIGDDNASISIPQASIHPIMFLPALGATMPPTYDQSDPEKVLNAGGKVAHYPDLFDALKRMGYETDRTLFLFPYDWLTSNVITAKHLRKRLEDASTDAAKVPWVAGRSNPSNITFDLIGHSTGNLVARAYIQVDLGVDHATRETFPVWNGHVRRWISIAGPLMGIYDSYEKMEGLVIPSKFDDPLFLAFVIWLPERAANTRIWPPYAQKICLSSNPLLPDRLRGCVYWWDDADKYRFAHDPVDGPTILPEFLPVYRTETEENYLVNQDNSPPILAGNLPFGRMANPLLEDAEVLHGSKADVENVKAAVMTPRCLEDVDCRSKLASMHNNVYDPYLQNIYTKPNFPQGYLPKYYGLNTPAAMQQLNERLGGIDQNLCVLYGGDVVNINLDDPPTHVALEVNVPGIYTAPHWFNGTRANFIDGKGDGYVAAVSANPAGIWGGQPWLSQDIDQELADAGRSKNALHTYIVGYDETVKHTVECLTRITIPSAMLSGFSSDSEVGEELNLWDKILFLFVHSPVELTIMDPLGRRLGYDPATGADLSEIPNATYFRDTLTGHKYLTIFAPQVGNHSLTVTGTGSGQYTLMETIKDGNQVIHPLWATGIITAGETFTQSIVMPENISDIPMPPEVLAGSDLIVNEDQPVTFSGSVKDINLGDTHMYLWDFGDTLTVTDTLTPTHSYANSGLYTTTLTVTDSAGFVISDTLQVTVQPMVNAIFLPLIHKQAPLEN